MCRPVDPQRPFLSAMLAPVLRVQDLDIPPKMAAWLVAIGQLLWADLFSWLLVILLVAHGVDWVYGRWAAHARGTFDERVSEWGLQSKIASILEVLLLRALEFTLAEHGLLQTHGAGAVAVTAALIYQDLRTIEQHREALGGSPIPILSIVLDGMQKVTDALIPTASPPPAPPSEDAEELEDETSTQHLP